MEVGRALERSTFMLLANYAPMHYSSSNASPLHNPIPSSKFSLLHSIMADTQMNITNCEGSERLIPWEQDWVPCRVGNICILQTTATSPQSFVIMEQTRMILQSVEVILENKLLLHMQNPESLCCGDLLRCQCQQGV